MSANAFWGSFAFAMFALWVLVEFIGILRWLRKLIHVLSSDNLDTVDGTLKQIERARTAQVERQYAATRNTRQWMNRPRGG